MTCVSTNSNCVIWQGPNIPCISLTTGDSVTTAIQNLANQLCALSTPDLDITSVNFGCVVTGLAPTTIPVAIQALVDKTCSIETLVSQIVPGSDPVLNLPACLQVGGVTSQPLSQYAVTVANKVCELVTLITGLQTQIDTLDGRVTLIETALLTLDPSGTTLPTVNSTCLGGTLGAQMNVALQLTIDQLCELKTILGSNTDLIAAVSAQCIANTDISLATGGTMSSIPGWIANPVSVADTIKNLWLALCDARSALEDVNSAVLPKCKDVVIDFDITFNSDRSQATLTLFNHAFVPNTFTNTAQSVVTFFDGITTYSEPINPILMSGSILENKVYNLDAISIDRTKNIKVTVTAAVTTPDGPCTKSKSKDYSYTCLVKPVNTLISFPSADSAVVSWNVPLTPEPVVNYTYQLFKNGILVRTQTITQNVVTIGSLEPGGSYIVTVIANFLCGVSDPVSTTFATKCYQITNAFAYFDTCIGGQADEFLGGSITISEATAADVNFSLEVTYADPGNTICSGALNTATLFGIIPAGQTQGIVNGCSSGIVITGGAHVCSVNAELLNGCAPSTAGASCPSPTSLTATLI